jgi:hypothetical protein
MATTTFTEGAAGTGTHRIFRRREKTVPRVRTWSVSLGLVGVIAVAVSAWGGLVPYLGPAIGFGGDGTPSWHWSLSHTLIGLVPGAVGLVVGLLLLAPRGTAVGRSKFALSWSGLVAIASGAWFMIGPLAWPVLYTSRAYFQAATPLRELEYWIGYALGPGLILAVCGAFALGWAARHDRPLRARSTGQDMPADEAVASASSPGDAQAKVA